MNSQGRTLCAACGQPAEFTCTCQALICGQCLNAHDSEHSDNSAVFVPLEMSQSKRVLDEETGRIGKEFQSLVDEINSCFDTAANSVERQRRAILAQLEEVRVQFLEVMKQEVTAQQKSLVIRKEAEAVLKSVRTSVAPLIEYSITVQQTVVSITSRSVPLYQPGAASQAVSEDSTELLYCVKSKSSEIYAFNPATEELSEEPVRCDRTLPKRGSYCFVPPGSLYYCGGKLRSSVVNSRFLIRLDSGEVVSPGQMYSPRIQHAVVHISGQVYIFGGYTGSTKLTSCEKFAVASGEQSRIADMNYQRDKIGAAVYQQKVYITGYGQGGEGALCRCIEVYDPACNAFSKVSFRLPTNSGTIAFAIDGCLGFLRSSALLMYDLRRDTQVELEAKKRRYGTCTSPVVAGLKVYYLVCTEDEYVVCCLDWQTKSSRELLNLKSSFM